MVGLSARPSCQPMTLACRHQHTAQKQENVLLQGLLAWSPGIVSGCSAGPGKTGLSLASCRRPWLSLEYDTISIEVDDHCRILLSLLFDRQ